jgi:small subunit ribosomal protein S8
MLTDQVADMLTRIRNGIRANKKTVSIPSSKLKKEITRILYENNFISKYAFIEKKTQGEIKILFKYDEDLNNAIQGIQKISKPGRRKYTNVRNMPKVLNGMGICIVSTSKGVMTDKECREMNVGGELIGKVW